MTCVCHNLFEAAARSELACPIRVFPKCHPRSAVEVFVQHKTKTITLVCARCDHTIAVIKVKSGNGRNYGLKGPKKHAA